MKILHVTKKYPDAVGGDAVVVSNLAKQQKAGGHHVTVLTNNCADIIDDQNVIKSGLRDTSIGLDTISVKRILSLAILFFRAFDVIKKVRPDVVHTHAVDMGMAISFAARYYKIPIVHTFHIVTFYDEYQSALRRKTELFLARIIHAVLITAPNKYDVMKLQAAGLGNVNLMPNGIDVSFWQRTSPVRKPSTFTFMTVGRLEQQKGYEFLINAALLLRKTNANFTVIIIGEGTEKDKLQELVRRGHALDYITFTGRQSPEQLREVYQSADAAIFPSLWETTPLTLLEAWAMQVPVILTRVGILQATHEYDDGVVLVKKQDESSLLQAMESLMSNVELRERIVRLGQQYVREFTWEKMSIITEQLYSSALKVHKDRNP